MADDESSDSSDDFLVAPDKIDLNSKFFAPTSKTTSNTSPVDYISSNDSSDDELPDEENKDSAALLAEVMKNLEKANSASTSFLPTPQSSSPKAPHKSPGKQKQNLADEINDLLLQGESGLGSFEGQSDDEEEKAAEELPPAYTIPKEGVNITLPGTALPMGFNRHKKRTVNLQEELVKKMNQRLRSSQIYIHKVGLLCWLAHGFHLNRQVNDPEVLSTAMSIVPQANCPDGRVDLTYLEKFTKYFRKIIKLEFNKENVEVTKDILLERLRKKATHNHRELVLIFIAILRAMGLNCRLVMSLCPPALKLRRDQLFQLPNKSDQAEVKEEKVKDKKTKKEPIKEAKKTDAKKSTKSKTSAKSQKKIESQEEKKSPSKIIPENSQAGDVIAKEAAKKKAAEVLRSKFSVTAKKTSVRDALKMSNVDDNGSTKSPMVNRLRSKTVHPAESTSKDKNTKDTSAETSKNFKLNFQRLRDRSKEAKSVSSVSTKSDDEDYFKDADDPSWSSSDEEIFQKKRKTASKSKSKSKNTSKSKASTSKNSSIDRRVLSSDDEETEFEKFDPRDSTYLWVEVFVESEESWISVSVQEEKIHCVSEIYKKAPHPVLYVVAWNSAGSVKDVTRRYCPHWLTATRKQRVDEKWWRPTLSTWAEKDTAMSRAEDEMLLQKELEQPLPKTLCDVKSHPLYVIAKHLLKFEALYPPDCVPLGHLPKTGDAIYSRHCVHTLRSRETWLKEARVVKPKQEPYKIVKSMPKYDKLTGGVLRDLPLELFGMWQTTPYEPPDAKNGIVPRNEYGNIYLFKQCMLPKGAVHIDLPGLGRIAKKLGIDCVQAMVGYSFGCGRAVPVLEGFVVCEEYEDTLREAWEQEQIEAAKRAKEKREKRVWGNWRKLIRGLMIKRNIAAKYGFGNDDDDDDGEVGESSQAVTKQNPPVSKKIFKKIQVPRKSNNDNDDVEQVGESSQATAKPKPKGSKKPARKTTASRKSDDEDDDDDGEEDEFSQAVAKRKPKGNTRSIRKTRTSRKSDSDDNNSEEDDDVPVQDEVSPPAPKRRLRELRKPVKKSKTSRKSDEDEDDDVEEVDEPQTVKRRQKDTKKPVKKSKTS